MATRLSESVKREMAAITLGTLIDFYGADMRLRNRTPDSVNTNLSHLRRFAVHAGGLDTKVANLSALIMIALGLFAVHTNPRAQLQVL
jgi:hypothetical protein